MDSPQKPPPSILAESPNARLLEIKHDDGRIEHPRVCQEVTDIRFRGVAVAVVVIAALLGTFAAAIRFFIHEKRANSAQASPSPLWKLPDQPRLEALQPQAAEQSFAVSDAARTARLHSYGAADEQGFVHIPIERAMQKLATDLQSQPPPQQESKSRGLIGGGEANSGRLFREQPQ